MKDNYSKYDAILGGIGVTVTLMLAGFFIAPIVTFVAGLGGVALAGYAMFVIPPTRPTIETEESAPSGEVMAAD